MQTSHLVTPAAAAAAASNTHHHHLNNNNNSYHYNPLYHNTNHNNNNNNHHTMSYTPHEQNNIYNNVPPTHQHHTSAASTNTTTTNNNNNHTPTASHKYAPARRLAARQTLRLQIPKQQGDSYGGASTTYYKHSPSQLPPAPILKRHQTPTPTTVTHQHHSVGNAFPKSASPLESHKLPNVVCNSVSPSSQLSSGSSLYYNGSNGGLSIQTATATPTSSANKFLNLRKPSITLNSADVRNNNGNSTGSIGSCGSDLFSFAKELSPSMDMSDHSPIFAEIASSISPSTSSGCSPTHHINRLFSLSPSTMRSYGNVSNYNYFHIRFTYCLGN